MEDFHGTLNPYTDFNNGYAGQVLNPIRRAFYNVNPFAVQEVPSHEQLGTGERFGNVSWVPPIFQNSQPISHLWPLHYDPSTDKSPNDGDMLFGKTDPMANTMISSMREELPRGCERARMNYNRCKMVNGKDKCQAEGDSVMSICPNWALAAIRNENRFETKVLLIQKAEYDTAMEVSAYNKGRCPAAVSNKTHVHGTRQHLRPDTLWADERYQSVTRDEVKAARARYEQRMKAAGRWDTPLKPEPYHPNSAGAQIKHEKPLY